MNYHACMEAFESTVQAFFMYVGHWQVSPVSCGRTEFYRLTDGVCAMAFSMFETKPDVRDRADMVRLSIAWLPVCCSCNGLRQAQIGHESLIWVDYSSRRLVWFRPVMKKQEDVTDSSHPLVVCDGGNAYSLSP